MNDVKPTNSFDKENTNLSEENKTARGKAYWWLNANPENWSFSNVQIGEEFNYSLCNEDGNPRRIHRNFLAAKAGDDVIGYETNSVQKVVAICRVTQENDGKDIYFEKTEDLSTPIEYSTLRNCPELEHMEFFTNKQGSLFKLTKREYDFIMGIIRKKNPIKHLPKYSKKDFLDDVYMKEERYDELEFILRNKKNIILQGASGVGKTFTAKRLAYAMMGEKDDSRIEIVQFHQNYSYEDFIMGYRPDGADFKLTNGIFYRFCQIAANNPDKEYFFIIDEINRGNMSKIFGEVLMLIEKDYRGTKISLAYNGEPFSVPENLYIIGMMNTADRSLAMIDYALRRRFSFFEMEPGFDSEGFKKYKESLTGETKAFDNLIKIVVDLNNEIRDDKSLGKGFCIGHSYFCGEKNVTTEWLRSIVDYDIIPTLSEYWFDDEDKLKKWKGKFEKWKEKPTRTVCSQAYTDIIIKLCKVEGIEYIKAQKLDKPLESDKIIEKLSGDDMTEGSCSSLAFAYIANKCGLDVTDYRGGKSRTVFSSDAVIKKVLSLDGVNAILNSYERELDGAIEVLRTADEGKQYYFAAGLHAAIVRCTEDAGLEYLEMQAANPKSNTWHPLTVDALKQRFKCRVSEDRGPNAGAGSSVRMRNVFMADIDTFQGSEEFAEIMGYINTRPNEQVKGKAGYEEEKVGYV